MIQMRDASAGQGTGSGIRCSGGGESGVGGKGANVVVGVIRVQKGKH